MSIPAWARVGAKVVLCRAIAGTGKAHEVWPVVGGVYTIRGVVIDADGCGLHLEEIVNKVDIYSDGVGEVDFKVERFRPIISQADDISTHFQALLSTPEKKEEDA